MKRILTSALALWMMAAPALAGGSTINVSIPAPNSAVQSAPIRNNFAAAANDINNLMSMFAGSVQPASPVTFQFWANPAVNPAPIRQFDGTQFVTIGFLDRVAHSFTPVVSAAAIMATAPIVSTVSGGVATLSLTIDGNFAVSGGALALAPGTTNLVMASPNGSTGEPSLRALVGTDLPNPSATSLGGVQSIAAVTSNWVRSISTLGVPTLSQPLFSDISGTLAPAQCPVASAAAFGCIEGDGATLTLTAGVASLNLAHSNTWSAAQSFAGLTVTTSFTATGLVTSLDLVNSLSLVTPNINVATGTSLALGGASIGGNALAVTGTALFNSATTLGAGGTFTGTFTGNPTLSGTVTLSGPATISNATLNVTGLGTSGTCSHSLVLTSGGAAFLAACPGVASAVTLGTTTVNSANGTNRLITEGTVVSTVGTLTDVPATIDSSGNLAAVNSLAGSVIATKAQQVTGSSATNVVTPSVQQNHDSAEKAWAFFGSCTSSPCTLTAGQSYGISTITRTSAGIYVVNFSTSFTSTGYACNVLAGSSSATVIAAVTAAPTVSAFTFDTVNTTFGLVDPTWIMVECAGRQ